MHRTHEISDEDRTILALQHRMAKTPSLRQRCEIVLLWAQGMSATEISAMLPYARSTVMRVLKRYREGGVNGLRDRPRSGRPRIVTPDYERQLIEVATQEPAAVGAPYPHWTTERLAEFMAARTGIRISARQVENYLKAHHVYLRRPTRRARTAAR